MILTEQIAALRWLDKELRRAEPDWAPFPFLNLIAKQLEALAALGPRIQPFEWDHVAPEATKRRCLLCYGSEPDHEPDCWLRDLLALIQNGVPK